MSIHRLSFMGYWREPNKSGVPAECGVFCVYTCIFDENQKQVTLRQLLYIDSAENARAKIAEHPKLDDWRQLLSPGEQLCYTFAPVDVSKLTRVTAALIHNFKPKLNSDYGNDFSLDDTSISVEGATAFLNA